MAANARALSPPRSSWPYPAKPPLPVHEEQALARQALAGSAPAKNAIIQHNMGFFLTRSRHWWVYFKQRGELDEYLSVTLEGAAKALTRFNPDAGLRFVSYAVHWVDAYCRNYARSLVSMVALTTAVERQHWNRVTPIIDRLTRELGRAPDDQEFAAAIGIKLNLATKLRERFAGGMDVSLQEPVAMGHNDAPSHVTSKQDFLEADQRQADELLIEWEAYQGLRNAVSVALSRLPPRERTIIENRVMKDDTMSLSELGCLPELDCSRERVRQLETKAKQKLRTLLEDWQTA